MHFGLLSTSFSYERSVPVVVGDEIEGNAQVSIAPRAANAMQVRLGVFGKVEVNDDVDCLNVDTTSEEICNSSHDICHYTR